MSKLQGGSVGHAMASLILKILCFSVSNIPQIHGSNDEATLNQKNMFRI